MNKNNKNNKNTKRNFRTQNTLAMPKTRNRAKTGRSSNAAVLS